MHVYSFSRIFSPRHNLDSADLVELFGWSESDWLEKTAGSAIRRIGYERWLRNIAVALGNARTSHAVIAALESQRDCNSQLVAEHVEWALEQHGANAKCGGPKKFPQ